MKSLFDSSAIFRAIKENKIDLLNGNYTLELARYELGNIVWKEYSLLAKVSEQEAKVMVKTVERTLSIMDVIEVAGNGEEILDTSIKHRITFYDASYAYFAQAKGLKLVTEDSRLIKKLTSTVNVSTLDGVK